MRIIVLLMVMVLIASFPFISDWVAKNKTSITYDKNYINDVIKGYVEDHPDHIMSSLHKYNRNIEEESRQSFVTKAVEENKDEVYDETYPTIGNGEVIKVVEFFDYACGYCKQVSSAVEKIIKDNESDIHYTFRELPILGPASGLVARAALSVNIIDQSKYLRFHKAALKHNSAYTEDVIKGIIENVGIDMGEFEKTWKSEEVDDLLKGSVELFNNLGLGGTPSFIVCGKIIIGADVASLMQAVNECKEHV